MERSFDYDFKSKTNIPSLITPNSLKNGKFQSKIIKNTKGIVKNTLTPNQKYMFSNSRLLAQLSNNGKKANNVFSTIGGDSEAAKTFSTERVDECFTEPIRIASLGTGTSTTKSRNIMKEIYPLKTVCYGQTLESNSKDRKNCSEKKSNSKGPTNVIKNLKSHTSKSKQSNHRSLNKIEQSVNDAGLKNFSISQSILNSIEERKQYRPLKLIKQVASTANFNKPKITGSLSAEKKGQSFSSKANSRGPGQNRQKQNQMSNDFSHKLGCQGKQEKIQISSLFNFNHSSLKINLNNNISNLSNKVMKEFNTNPSCDSVRSYTCKLNEFLKKTLNNILNNCEALSESSPSACCSSTLVEFINELHQKFVLPFFPPGPSSNNFMTEVSEFKDLIISTQSTISIHAKDASSTSKSTNYHMLIQEFKMLKEQIKSMTNDINCMRQIDKREPYPTRKMNSMLSRSIGNLSSSNIQATNSKKEISETCLVESSHKLKSRFSKTLNPTTEKQTLSYSSDVEYVTGNEEYNMQANSKNSVNLLNSFNLRALPSSQKNSIKYFDENKEVSSKQTPLQSFQKLNPSLNTKLTLKLDSIYDENNRISDFQEEFLSKVEEFSESWRKEVKKMRK